MYSFKLPTEIHYFDNLSEFIKEFSLSADDLVVTNEIIYNNSLLKHGSHWNVVFQEKYGAGEPNDKMINGIIKEISGKPFKRVVALGGGTVIDIGKILALANLDNVLDVLYGRVPAVKQKEVIVLPTTCGTGSEVTNIAILEDTTAHVKKGIQNKDMYPNYAVLIPELLKGLPFKFFAFSSVDALIHAMESFLAPKSNPITEMYGLKAMEMIIGTYKKIAAEGQKAAYENIGDVLLASTYAGIAFGNTGVGAVHALSYPLGGKYHVAHGESNYAMFDGVFKRYDERNPEGKIRQLKVLIKRILGSSSPEDKMITELDELINKVIPRKKLREYGFVEGDIEAFADSVIEGQQRLLVNNYVPLSRDEIAAIYRALY